MRALDEFGNETVYPALGSPPATFTVPARLTAPPGISGVSAVALPDGTASVQWDTGQKADGQVEFGSSPALGDEGLGSGVGTAHQV